MLWLTLLQELPEVPQFIILLLGSHEKYPMIESRDVLKMKYKQDWTLIAKGQVWLSDPIDCKSSEGRESVNFSLCYSYLAK